MVDVNVLGSLALLLVTLVLGVYAVMSAEVRRRHPWFVALALGLFAGALAHLAVRVAHLDTVRPLWWILRVGVAWTALIFSVHYARHRVDPSRALLSLATAAALAVALAAAAELVSPPLQELITTLTSGALLGGAIWVALDRRRRSRSRLERQQLMDFIGAYGAVLAGGAMDLVGSAFGADWDISILGLLVGLFIFARGVTTRQLVDVDELVGRGILVFLSIFSLYLAYRGLGVLWGGYPPGPEVFVMAIATTLLLGSYDPVRRWAGRWARTFRGDEVRLQRRLVEASRDLISLVDLPAMFATALRALHDTPKIHRAWLYWAAEPEDDLQQFRYGGARPRIDAIERAKPAVSFLARRRVATSRDQVEHALVHLREGEDKKALRALARTLTVLSADWVVPLVFRGQLDGLLFLQLTENAHLTRGDLRAVDGVARQLALGIQHARLYERNRLRDRLAGLGQMSLGLAHEIRNPLGAIKAAAQLLSSGLPAAEQEEFLGIVVEEVDRLDRVVTTFLDFARPLRLDLAAEDLRPLVERCLKLVALDNPGVDVRAVLGDEPVPAAVQADALGQALLNILRNACEAMEGQGRLDVTLGRARDGRAFITVEDEGPGMSKEVLAHLFDPFFTTKDRGSGLGLALAHRIVSAHGGAIRVWSREGRGTRMQIFLPRSEVGS